MRLADFPRHPLLFGPSPVHRLDRLTAHLGGAGCGPSARTATAAWRTAATRRASSSTWSRTPCEGVRHARVDRRRQSNHTRQVAAVAARTGLKAVLVQESWVDWPDVIYDRVGNIQLSRIMGADVRLVGEAFGIGFKRSWEEAIESVERAGGTPYAIPAGASDHELGGMGFAGWAAEVEQQERELGVFFDTVVVCSVTGSTQAGMIAGFAAQDRPRRVIGIDGSATPQATHAQVARIARRTADLLGVRALRDDEIVLDDRWHAGTYGIPDAKTVEAIRLAGRLEGMLTDPVYEGKSMAAMIDLVASGEIGADSTVLYAHLGGQPALSAYAALFK